MSEWDNEVLALEFEELSQLNLDIDLELTGFSLAEIEAITSIGKEPQKAEDELPEVDEKAVSRLGDIFLFDGGHRLICGDSCDPAVHTLLMQGNEARLAVTDPPYGVAISGFVSGNGKAKHREFVMGAKGTTPEQLFHLLHASARNMADHTVNGALHMTFIDFRHVLDLLLAGKEVYSELKQICVWVKPNGGMGTFYRSQHEFCVIQKVGTAPHTQWQPNQTIIEKPSVGHALAQDMRRGPVRPLLITPKFDKAARLAAESAKFERGQVLLPLDAPWLGPYLEELLAFPYGRNDDQVDSTSQALKYKATKIPSEPRAESARNVDRPRPRGRIGAKH